MSLEKSKRNKVVAVVPFHLRINVSKIFWSNIRHLKKQGVDIEVVAVVSDKPNQNLAKQNTEHVVKFKNNPVGMKWNVGVGYTKSMDYDFLLIVGSDDIFSKEFLDRYFELFNNKSIMYSGVLDASAINLYTKKARYFGGYKKPKKVNRVGESVGSGRILRKSLVEMLNYTLFENKNRSLDWTMTMRIRQTNATTKNIKTGKTLHRLGLKSNTSIGKMFGKFVIEVNRNEMTRIYGKETTKLIFDFA